MIIPSWVKYLGILLLLLAIVGGIFKVGDSYGYNRRDVVAKQELIDKQKANADLIQKQRDDNASLQAQLSKTSGQLQTALNTHVDPVVQYVTRTVTKEIEKPVYLSCAVPASGVSVLTDTTRQLNQLRSTKN